MSMPWERYDGGYTSGWDNPKRKPAKKKTAAKKTTAKPARKTRKKRS